MTGENDGGFRCALCGARFQHGGVVCGACPIAAGCDLVKCPHCGYQFPRASRLVSWAQRLAARVSGGAAPAAGAHASCPQDAPRATLATLEVGEPATVTAVGLADPRLAVRLSHLGLVPGATVRLRQRRPSTVVQVGETTLALQRSIAETIEVRRVRA